MLTQRALFKLGLIINPIAGIGGSVALKGSDGMVEKAQALGAVAKANERTQVALNALLPYKDQLVIYTVNGLMGQHLSQQLGFNCEVVYQSALNTSEKDTQNAVRALAAKEVDVLLFAGGDGTARNICQVIAQIKSNHAVPVLGIPAGCKIHSGVYAVTPKAAGRVVELMLTGQLVSFIDADVMDIDETLFRQGIVKAKRYGDMKVPQQLRYVQAVKSGGKELDELILQDIAAYVIDQMDDDLFIIGSGSTTGAIMSELGVENTLLGVDVLFEQKLLLNDITEPALWQLINEHLKQDHAIKLVITVIGGQGHIFGRGNQQLSPRIIKAIGKDNIIVVATKNKLASLAQRPLIADTGDVLLDAHLCGYLPIITGYNDQVLYPVASPN